MSRPTVPLPFRVEKQAYSHGAWRVLDADGAQVWTSQVIEHASMGTIAVPGPVCFDRKRDALAWVEANTPHAVPAGSGHPVDGGQG